ncbi:MAG: GAF domain-containing protein [Nitrospinota bacterium]|nr:GAF domain-containing protein [Nitrospinota bacterium]
MCRLPGIEFAELFVRDDRSGALNFAGAFGEQVNPDLSVSTFTEEEGFPQRVARRRGPIIVTKILKDPGWIRRRWAEEWGLRTFLGVPLTLKGRVVGTLDCFSTELRTFEPTEIKAVEDIADVAAIALENARLYSETEKRTTTLEVLDEISKAIGATLDLDELFKVTVEQVKRVVPCDRSSLYRVDVNKRTITDFSLVDDAEERMDWVETRRDFMGSHLERVLETRQPTYIKDTLTSPDPRLQSLEALRVRSTVHAPIVSEGDCVGLLNVGSEETDAFTDEHIDLLRSVADHLAIAIQNAELYSESRQRATNLEILDEIAKAINSTLDLGEVFRITSEQVKRAVRCERCSLYKLDRDKKFIAEFFVADDDPDRGRWIKDNRGLEGSQFKQILDTKKSFYEPDTRKSPYPRIQSLTRTGLVSAFCAPILREGDCIGFLNIGAEKADAFTEEQTDLLVSVADHLALAMKNADLYAQAKESGERLDNFVRGASDGIVTLDLEGRITSRNPAAEAMYGYTEQETIGCHASEIFEEDEGKTRDLIERLKTGETLPSQERTERRKDGSPVEVSVTLSAIRDGAIRVVGISGINRDITGRKRAEEALKLTQFFVERAADATYWIAADGRLLYVNDAACDCLGYSREELLSKAISDINPNFPPGKWPAHWEEIKRGGSLTFETQNLTKDGRRVPIEVSANYLEFDGKEYDFAFVRDITGRKRAEEAAAAHAVLHRPGGRRHPLARAGRPVPLRE